jgi:hypothetical protein
MRERDTSPLFASDAVGLELLEALRQYKLVELTTNPEADDYYSPDNKIWTARRELGDVMFEIYERGRELLIARRPEATPDTITKFKDATGQPIRSVEQVSGFLCFDDAATRCGQLAVRKALPRIPFLASDESRFNVNFRRQYRALPFLQQRGPDDLRPAVNIAVL